MTTPEDRTSPTADRDSRTTAVDRRAFLRAGTAGAAAIGAAWALPGLARQTHASYRRAPGSNARLQVAFIGVSGIGSGQHIAPLAELGATCPCYADADSSRFGPAATRWADAEGYTDYRRMYDRHMNEIDAVMVGTPDHHHYPATIIAMMEGKHAYTQKPLTHTPWEARQLTEATKKYKLATQMGNQGHAWEGLLQNYDHLRQKSFGEIVEAHIWTNRPVWRQDMKRPEGGQPVPEKLDWEAWVGPAPMRPFRQDPADGWGGYYHPFNWRGFWDFGCGALGDMACHEMDSLFWALDPGQPTSVELVDGEPFGDADQYRKRGAVTYSFPAKNGRPAFKLTWYEGGAKPPKPDFVTGDLTAEGAIYVGTNGTLVAMPSARSEPTIYRDGEQVQVPITDPIARSIGHHKEWYEACVGNASWDSPRGNFLYSGPFTETVLLGCIAQRVGGTLEYDAKSFAFTNSKPATELLTKAYRSGWDFRM